MTELFDLSAALARAARVHVEVGETHIRLAVQDWIVANIETLTRDQIASLQAAAGIETQAGGL